MFKLTSKLAWSNLIKNRKLYYPFALAVILATAILYTFISLASAPGVEGAYGGAAARSVLGLGTWVIQAAVIILVTYANSFVMKNRSSELGLYSILGMEKKHLLFMSFVELMDFYVITVGLGIGVGMLFDRLLFAVLLKLMGLPVVIQSIFQVSTVLMTLLSLLMAFGVILLLNFTRLLRQSSLQLIREKKAGEKRGRFLWLQTILGLGFLSYAFYSAQDISRPIKAIPQFFIAVVLVIIATYLLFNAGSITFLSALKKRKSYYYKPDNFISVSNLISRMRKNAAGLATITILSTMVLVTMVGSINIFIGGKNYMDTLYPNDYNIGFSYNEEEEGAAGAPAKVRQIIENAAEKTKLKDYQVTAYTYKASFIQSIQGNQVQVTTLENTGQMMMPEEIGSFYVLDQATYQQLTGQKVDLEPNQVLAYGYHYQGNLGKDLVINGKNYQVKQVLSSNFLQNKISQQETALYQMGLYLVVPDLSTFDFKLNTHHYYAVQSPDKKNTEFITEVSKGLYEETNSGFLNVGFSYTDRYTIEKQWKEMAGTLLFIGVFLSVIFLLGTVLVIYYKQISEGYEDRENFVILQKVGLDQKQTSRTIRKQIITVFFLPLIFAFLYLGFAYKMVSLIVRIFGGTNSPLLLQTTLGICTIFMVSYILVFLITSRSYRKIVQRNQ